MAKRTRKTLPKDFRDLLIKGDMDAIKAVYEKCKIDAYESYSKLPALSFYQCFDELTHWLIEQGANIMARDTWEKTPLHVRASHPDQNIEILLKLGADVNCNQSFRGTPLHCSAQRPILSYARILVAYGADVNIANNDGLTPLAIALQEGQNADLIELAPYAAFLLEAGAHKTPEMKKYVASLGHGFEFHRNSFNPDYVAPTSDALYHLYEMFDVEPVPRRTIHDGETPIVAVSSSVDDQHYELWQLLVPSEGAADTVQGEVIRISGKLYRELAFDGGVNWSAEFRKMAKAFLVLISSGQPLPPETCMEAKEVVDDLDSDFSDASELLEMAVNWVALNPQPAKLPPPNYKL